MTPECRVVQLETLLETVAAFLACPALEEEMDEVRHKLISQITQTLAEPYREVILAGGECD